MTVRIGITGPGGMRRAHIGRIVNELAGGQVVAVFDVDAANAARVAEPLGATVYATSAELIAAAEVDAVMITSGGPFHEADLLRAVKAGKPVFCEKPLTPTAAASVRVMEAEQEAGRKLVTVGFMRRSTARTTRRRRSSTREHGEAILVHNRHRNPTVPESYTADMAINDTAIHGIDTMRWLPGEEIVRVRVDKPKKTSNRFPHLQDPLVLVMESDSGVLIDDEVFVNIGYAYDIQCELVLESGTVSLADQNVITRRDSSGARNRLAMDHNQRFHLAFNSELQQWINAVAKGEHTGSSSRDGYAAAVVCDAGVQALESDESSWIDVQLMVKPALYA